MTDAELLALHRDLVATPSVSHEEGPLADRVEAFLAERGCAPRRLGDNVFAAFGEGPVLCLNSHLDTVPPAEGWTRDPHAPVLEDGRLYGLGANDAKASVAAMIAAFLRLKASGFTGATVLLTLVPEEETGGRGTEALLPELARLGLSPDAAVVGEPTGLDVAVAQKGLLILELVARGDACHAANRKALGATNALSVLARDLVALEGVDLGAPHPSLGEATLEPTMASAGTAKNAVPGEARAVLDVRTNPEPGTDALLERIGAAVDGEVRVLSRRLVPTEIAPEHPLVLAARDARPEATLFGSRGLSDLVFFAGVPGVKVGPGRTERSHTPDEYVLVDEVVAGARFYERLVRAYAGRAEETGHGAAVGSR